MKTEQEIRRLIAKIESQQAKPCACRGTQHRETCRAGYVAMEAQKMGLRWVLGELSDLEIYAPLNPPWDVEKN